MTKFRSKPFEIEAVQLTRDFAVECLKSLTAPKGLTILINSPGSLDPTGVVCRTRQGNVDAEFGDWIIQESDGSGCYPCNPQVFSAKYEPID